MPNERESPGWIADYAEVPRAFIVNDRFVADRTAVLAQPIKGYVDTAAMLFS